MSDCIGPSCRRSSGSASRDGKPRHVKCLNFGQSILELDVVDQLGCFATSNHALVVERSVPGIPCTKKKDYVRKWIETHEDGGSDPSDGLLQSSPVLGKSKIKTCETSPVLGNSRKRRRKGTRINRHAVARSVDDTDSQKQNAWYFTSCAIQPDVGSKGEHQNEQEYLHKMQCTPPGTEVVASESPVLGTCLYSYKRRRRKLWYGTDDYVFSKHLKLHDDKITTVHKVELDNDYNTVSEKTVDRDELEEGSDNNVKETGLQIETAESPEKSQIYTRIFLSQTRQTGSEGNSSFNKVNPRIEIDTSDESRDKEYSKLSSTNDGTDSLNNCIEEAETQDMLPDIRTSQFSAKSLFTSKSRTKPSQMIANDLNETYCSEAEIMQNYSTHLSTKISLVPSLTKEVTESKSTQTPVISTISTPSKASPDKTMYARLLDSGKKHQKPKKGSLVAKLQSLINTKISDIRIWRHRMNKKHDAASAQFISVLVHNCSKRFGNQFLRGTLIEDRFNLLQSDAKIGEAEACNVQTPPRRTSRRDLTIILVCDIVGTLKMMSQVVINVHPPWDVLDKVDLTLGAMYISISHGQEVPNLDPDKDNSRKRERRVVKEFNCPCIEEERELPFCARKPSADKPDVMQRIFDF